MKGQALNPIYFLCIGHVIGNPITVRQKPNLFLSLCIKNKLGLLLGHVNAKLAKGLDLIYFLCIGYKFKIRSHSFSNDKPYA